MRVMTPSQQQQRCLHIDNWQQCHCDEGEDPSLTATTTPLQQGQQRYHCNHCLLTFNFKGGQSERNGFVIVVVHSLHSTQNVAVCCFSANSYQKDNNQQPPGHVESNSMCPDRCQFTI
jgi:hypothetical protein